ncbi:hypothetical protein NPIL_393131 [Nephila pilipes]|uniref:RED-like N-terminal domain-containing protein n=1 Tax=Nephila pilipes TaxID=299642 RepID=A0A8X6PPA5_NEPPI|nr:hypothetical protein NPIL_393131 [Nephila pilipes]
MEFQLEKLRIGQLGKAYLDSSVGEKTEKNSTPCHEMAKMMPRAVLVLRAVSKKLASKLLLSTTANEALKEKVQAYGHESPSDENLHVTGEEKIEDSSVSTDVFVDLLLNEIGDVNINHRNIYRAEEKRDGVNPDNQNEDSITFAANNRAIAPDAKSVLDSEQ